MKSTTETLRVTKKYIRWVRQGRTPISYCTYIAENKNHRHKLKVRDDSKLFDLLKSTRIYKNQNESEYDLLVDAHYLGDKFTHITNPRKM